LWWISAKRSVWSNSIGTYRAAVTERLQVTLSDYKSKIVLMGIKVDKILGVGHVEFRVLASLLCSIYQLDLLYLAGSTLSSRTCLI